MSAQAPESLPVQDQPSEKEPAIEEQTQKLEQSTAQEQPLITPFSALRALREQKSQPLPELVALKIATEPDIDIDILETPEIGKLLKRVDLDHTALPIQTIQVGQSLE